MADPIANNLRHIQHALQKTLHQFGANNHTIPEIIAVSKKQPIERVEALLVSGHRLFGENRVQEAQSKWPQLRKKYPDIRLHLIGSLQTNKVKDAITLFDCIETVDREKIAKKIAQALEHTDRTVDCMIQLNTGEESQKSGIMPNEAGEFITYCIDELKLPIIGLMCIPPKDEPPAPHFALLRKLGQQYGLKHLSMGMSNDYTTAATQGATYVRVGTAIFGQRPTNPQF